MDWSPFIGVEVLVAQLCPTLCDPMDYSPLGSSVNGILQARILEWVAISISRRSSQEDLALISKESNLGKPQLGLYGPLLAKSMLFNMLSSFVIVFLPRVKRLLLSWFDSKSFLFSAE